MRAYKSILEVIYGKTDKRKEKQGNDTTTITATIDYYEAARIAYINGQYMRKISGL